MSVARYVSWPSAAEGKNRARRRHRLRRLQGNALLSAALEAISASSWRSLPYREKSAPYSAIIARFDGRARLSAVAVNGARGISLSPARLWRLLARPGEAGVSLAAGSRRGKALSCWAALGHIAHLIAAHGNECPPCARALYFDTDCAGRRNAALWRYKTCQLGVGESREMGGTPA